VQAKTLILRILNYKSNVKDLYLHPTGEFISDQIRGQRIHYELDLLTKIRLLVNYSCFIDIGANIGNHSNYFSFYGAHGWAFEPSTENYKLLCLNALNFSTVKTALGAHQSKVEVFTFREAMGNSHVAGSINSSSAGEISGIEIVDLRKLNDFDISCATLVKIDTEGFEIEVLRGAKLTLEKYSPALWIEVHENVNLMKSNARYLREDIMKTVMKNGYFFYYKLDNTNYLFSKKRRFFMRRISLG
jgi:FkbM family methyltransferase